MLREALFGIVCSFQIYFHGRFQRTSRNRFVYLRDWTETIKTLYGVMFPLSAFVIEAADFKWG